MVLAPDVAILWDADFETRLLVRAWSGDCIRCERESLLASVAFFFSSPRRRDDACKSFSPRESVEAAVDRLLLDGFLLQSAQLVLPPWNKPDPIDAALHLQAGWRRKTDDHGREVVARLAKEPARAKSYPICARQKLPAAERVSLPLDKALEQRRSHRRFGRSGLDAIQLSTLLHHAAGLQGYLDAHPFADKPARPYPSGGGRHPLEIYALIRQAGTDLEEGAFHWSAAEGSLERLGTCPRFEEQVSHFRDRENYLEAPLWLLVSSVTQRRSFKYERTVMRHILIECGALLQNLYLVATGLGLSACPFDVRRYPMESWLGLDPVDEPLLLGVALGYAADFVHPHPKPQR